MRSRPVSSRPIRSAFTLVEIVMALLIMTIVAAIAAPKYAGSVQRYRLDAAAKRIAADLEYAATYAKAQSATQTIAFNIPGCAYTSGVTSPDRRSTSYTVSLTQDPYRVSLISASFGGSASLTIDGFGIPAAGGSVLIGAGKEARRITVAQSTGKASITSEWIP